MSLQLPTRLVCLSLACVLTTLLLASLGVVADSQHASAVLAQQGAAAVPRHVATGPACPSEG